MTKIKEVWKDVNGHEYYKISSFGRIKSIRTNKILKPLKTTTGYFQIQFHNNGGLSQYRIHRLVAFAFIPNKQNKPFINHKNGVKTDNMVENLEWCTASENVIHAYNSGLNKNVRPVSCFSNGVLVKTYQSARKAELDGHSNQLISKCCSGLRKFHNKMSWVYA